MGHDVRGVDKHIQLLEGFRKTVPAQGSNLPG
jgi:hypothetical protein